MTPTKEAKELVDKYLKLLYGQKPFYKKGDYFKAKKCALIAVDEVQEHAQMIDGDYGGYSSVYYYFKKVIEEIELIEKPTKL